VATERRRTRHDGKGCRGAALERLAEQHHLADALGRALLARSCRQLSGWRRQGVAVPPLSLRLPGAWVGRADFAIELTQLLQRHHLSGRHLRLELGCAALRALQGDAGHLLLDAGIDLIADVSDVDLATLAACRRLPVACLAVDLATLGDITVPDSHARTTLATLTSLARGLGMRLLVKSVDHAEELELLGQLGADEYQGATLARPLPARTWTTLLSESTAGSLLDAPAPMAWPVLV
jgi:EAL domain-containing protein (putative c-di-GMP-specific phosphodiesterase class I)